MAIYKVGSGYSIYLHGEGRDWHRTKQEAVRRAEELRVKKLQSLDRQILKISAIDFGKYKDLTTRT